MQKERALNGTNGREALGTRAKACTAADMHNAGGKGGVVRFRVFLDVAALHNITETDCTPEARHYVSETAGCQNGMGFCRCQLPCCCVTC